MSDIKPITIYVHAKGPNPKKVIIIFEELGVPYTAIPIENPKDESFTKINPNGRLPAIEDPNTGLTLWESGAIIEYLIETYDKEHKLTFTSAPEKWQLKQYLHFQMSGQGPYFGQTAWFHFFHPEDVPSAKERYKEQAVRVVQVLDKILEGKEYLVGDKCTYADLAFVPWNNMLPMFGDTWAKYEIETKYTNFFAWHQRLLARPTVKKGLQNIE
ncbi:glutathione S-transferase [Ilyonectria robusta]|uniref:glutathione S-transferase n=1 Tax=Ilyonectria robusta TaxID=1079257 RepID=UPI001E8CDAEC|nr:glutathione S-transferase [Ilyonectria robusta]KAH8735990.1 glutathione S-transferase [Ilyonectria robusta]